MQLTLKSAPFRPLSALRRGLLLVFIVIGISIQLSVPEGTSLTDIAIDVRDQHGRSLDHTHLAPPTSATALSGTAVSAPRSATLVSAPQSATTTRTVSRTAVAPASECTD